MKTREEVINFKPEAISQIAAVRHRDIERGTDGMNPFYIPPVSTYSTQSNKHKQVGSNLLWLMRVAAPKITGAI